MCVQFLIQEKAESIKKGSREVSLFYHPVVFDDSPQGHRRPIGLSVFCAKIPDPVAASDDALLITRSSSMTAVRPKAVKNTP